MTTYKSLFDDVETLPVRAKPKEKEKQKFTPGCTNCPLNKEGCVKVIGLSRVVGRKVMVWAQAPGLRETQYVYIDKDGVKRRGMELIGPSGQFFWRYMGAVGLRRDDCDIQNVVRCRPTKSEDGKTFDRKPTTEEIKHCSIYTAKALEKNNGQAKVHIVLGLVAAGALLGKEFRKDQSVFWSDKLKAKVICVAHPAFFLRSGFARSKLKQFREGLKAAVEVLKGKGSRFSYVESQNYGAIKRASTLSEFGEQIKKASKTERIVFDIEHGPRGDGKVVLCVGFSFQRGMARTVYLDKSDVKIDDRGRFLEIFEKLFTDKEIRWAAHHSVSDVPEMRKILGIKISNLDYDTEYAEYICYSNRRSYSLAEIAEVRFPVFAGYKDIIKPYLQQAVSPERDYDKIPHEIMTLYNGGDSDLTKHIEKSTEKKVSLPLLHVYMDAAFPIAAMQERGPLLDYEYYNIVESVLPNKIKRIQQQLALMSGNPDFNPASVPQVRAFLYGKLRLPKVEDRSGKLLTGKHVLAHLSQYHQAPAMIDQHRKLTKMDSTYLRSYKKSADMHNGELRTTWWLTGTVTARLRSGGADTDKKSGEKKKKEGIVNLQNIHGDDLVQNLLISDRNWRRVLELIDEDPEIRREIDGG